MKNALTLSLLTAALLMACSPEKEADTTVATQTETTTTTTDNQDLAHDTSIEGGSITMKSEHGAADTGKVTTTTTTQNNANRKGQNETAVDPKITNDQTQTLTVVTSSNPEFSTLNQLITDAGLTETLDSGEYTLFAPTNEAFAQIPAATLNALKKDKAKLRQVLMYHVLPNKVPAAQVMKMNEATSLEDGQKLMLTKKGDQVMIGNAKIIKTDVMASNGVVHVIDHVLIPKNLTL